ncbi:MAG TPA: serine/threonine-protein kinase [Verrucomicrobiae bacterium]|jgi:WD40 repeat protein/serine/threonine protein kinase
MHEDPKMKPDSHREEALFQAASQLTGTDRATFLDRVCAGDAALRQRLEALLAAHEEPEGALAEPAPAAKGTMKLDLADVPDETVGQKIGRYKILEKVGEGGCGVVYVAEQTEPVRRRVALKVIKLGMDTKQVVARFEAERQALAMMDHPNIAKVLDAGTTETGRPYFIMELVRGIRITDYCDQEKVPTNERLELFIQICHAIQHAHQKGIIHRDIKPSNILVTLHDGVPVPKVIDFGIAKATEGRLTDATVYTQLHQFIGTPAYMSPEQAEMSGLDIDTRSDIYSLGVLLYELLTGKTPFDATELMSQGIDEMRKTIREIDPVRPSTKLATLQGEELTTTARRRSVDRSRLLHELKGDLDWIVMKCLEKDRKRRYETTNGLAMDLKRHLSNETVVARPPSQTYRFQKLVRRNKLAFAAGAAIAAALVFGIIVSTWQAMRATRAKQQALVAQASETLQRQKAEANEQKALAAQKAEAAEEFTARQRAYASDMNVAAQALAENNLGRAQDLLNRQRPEPGQIDLRGWEWRYLWGQTRSDALFTLCHGSSEINSVVASPAGNWLATGVTQQGGLSLWDLRTRQELVRLAKNASYVRAAFSPTAPLLAFSGATFSNGQWITTLCLWNTATRQMMAELPLDNWCDGLAFAKDGQTLVTATDTGHITLWHMPEGTRIASFASDMASHGYNTTFAATPDLSLAAYASDPVQFHIIDLRNGKELWTAGSPDAGAITALAFSPDGKILASSSHDETNIRLWDVATGKQVGELIGHSSWTSPIVFWPDGKKLASGSGDQTIRIWDISDPKNPSCLDVLRGHRLEIWRLALLPDNKTLVSGCKDGTVCFWDTSVTHPHQSRITLPLEHINDSHFAPDGRSLLVLDDQGGAVQWSGSGFQQKTPLLNAGTNIDSDCFSPDGRFLALGWTNGTIQVWDTSQRVLLYQLTNAIGLAENFLDDGKKLITFSVEDNLLHEWNLATGAAIQSWQAPVGLELHFHPLALAPDERSFMAAGDEGNLILRNLVDQSQTYPDLGVLEISTSRYSPDGRLFAVSTQLGYARVWNAASWKPVATLGGFLNGTKSVNFSSDGKRLAVASNGQQAVRLYDTDSWQDVFTLDGQKGYGVDVSFSPDGNTLVWQNINALYLWHAPSWDEINAAEAKDQAENEITANTQKDESNQ